MKWKSRVTAEVEDILTDQRQNVKKQEEENDWQLNAISPVAAAVLGARWREQPRAKIIT